MNRQSTFWARLHPKREVRHLWHGGREFDISACGLFTFGYMNPESKGRKCKSCLRALAK